MCKYISPEDFACELWLNVFCYLIIKAGKIKIKEFVKNIFSSLATTKIHCYVDLWKYDELCQDWFLTHESSVVVSSPQWSLRGSIIDQMFSRLCCYQGGWVGAAASMGTGSERHWHRNWTENRKQHDDEQNVKPLRVGHKIPASPGKGWIVVSELDSRLQEGTCLIFVASAAEV